MAYTPEQLRLYRFYSDKGEWDKAYQALEGGGVAPVASAAPVNGLLGLGSADAGALQGLLSQFRRAEEERQFANAGRDEAPIGDHERNPTGFGRNLNTFMEWSSEDQKNKRKELEAGLAFKQNLAGINPVAGAAIPGLTSLNAVSGFLNRFFPNNTDAAKLKMINEMMGGTYQTPAKPSSSGGFVQGLLNFFGGGGEDDSGTTTTGGGSTGGGFIGGNTWQEEAMRDDLAAEQAQAEAEALARDFDYGPGGGHSRSQGRVRGELGYYG